MVSPSIACGARRAVQDESTWHTEGPRGFIDEKCKYRFYVLDLFLVGVVIFYVCRAWYIHSPSELSLRPIVLSFWTKTIRDCKDRLETRGRSPSSSSSSGSADRCQCPSPTQPVNLGLEAALMPDFDKTVCLCSNAFLFTQRVTYIRGGWATGVVHVV